jgi:anti-anti-sigma factor
MEISNRAMGNVQVLDVWRPAAVTDGHHVLREAFFDAIECGSNLLILNLNHAEMLDSLMLGETVACAKRARERGGDVRLVVVPDGIVHELLQLTGLDHVFQIFGDEKEAMISYTAATT